jgi:Zn-dependent protease with chaperone function
MQTTQNPSHDYKKWILFNNGLSDHQNLYDLYTAIKHKKKSNNTDCSEQQDSGIRRYLIECASVAEKLEVTEHERNDLLAYLVQHYFHTENVDEWFRQRQHERDIHNNHQYAGEEAQQKQEIEIEPHYKEARYYNIKLFVSILAYLSLAGFLVFAFLSNPIQAISTVVVLGLVVLLFGLLSRIARGFILGIIKGNAVRITERQYPEIFKIVREQCKQLQLKDMPEIYVTGGHFNAFVMKFARTKVLMLYSEVVETFLNGDDSILRFVIGHELGHIKRKHLTTGKWLLPSSLIPFLDKAYSRGCEYTCDRVGFRFSQKGAIQGILILATGKEIFTKINADQFVSESVHSGSFWMWFSEKFLSHPHTAKRLDEIRKYAQ